MTWQLQYRIGGQQLDWKASAFGNGSKAPQNSPRSHQEGCAQRRFLEPEAESSPLSSVEQPYGSFSTQSPREDEVKKLLEVQNCTAEHTEPLLEGSRANSKHLIPGGDATPWKPGFENGDTHRGRSHGKEQICNIKSRFGRKGRDWQLMKNLQKSWK